MCITLCVVCLLARNVVSNKRKQQKRTPFCGGSKPIKPVVMTGRNEMKLPILSSSELGVSSGSEDTWKKESVDEADSKCFYSAGLFSEDQDSEEWVQCQTCLKWASSTVCVNYWKRVFVCGRCKKWQTLFYCGC
jgi:hypothetical protein